jgi:hypothetical protein
MDFIQVWLMGYVNPIRFVSVLRNKPAPHWGLSALLIRGLADALLLYLPVSLMGRIPPTPSYITFFATENYYQTLIWLTPLVFTLQWLLGSAVMHLMLRLGKHRSDMDQLLNLTGMASLVVGIALLLWDWFWYFIGGMDQYWLGASHLVIDLWWFILIIIGLQRNLGVPKWYGVIASVIAFVIAFPLAVLFMRAPF